MGQTAFPYQAVRGLPAKTLAARNSATSGPLGTVSWAAASTGDVLTVQGDGTVAFAAVSAGITSLNGLTAATQTFAVGTTGTDVAFVSAAGVHTLNIPDASATARGLVTTGTQTIAGTKTFAILVTSGGTQLARSLRLDGIAEGGFGPWGYLNGWTWMNSSGALSRIGTTGIMSQTTLAIGWGNPFGNTFSTSIFEDAGDVIAQRRGTNAQAYRVYNTHTSSTSFERLNIAWASDVCTIEVTAGTAGGTLRGLKIGGASTSLLGFYGATPVDRPDTIADPAGGGTIDAEARTAINTIIDRLQELGLIA